MAAKTSSKINARRRLRSFRKYRIIVGEKQRAKIKRGTRGRCRNTRKSPTRIPLFCRVFRYLPRVPRFYRSFLSIRLSGRAGALRRRGQASQDVTDSQVGEDQQQEAEPREICAAPSHPSVRYPTLHIPS